MAIGLAIALLTYAIILAMSYVVVIFTSEAEKNRKLIINTSYNHAFSVLFICILIVFILFLLPPIQLDVQKTSYLILASKFLSILTLGGSLFFLKRRRYKN
ncbi:hypothetical protein D1B31_14530 [Neobacillus notoginsengisoli]|uniref:Uncharacterized protein n=1 Tax=Neobacillus notoginsengisoli TaxID=1578198 RepID=A0A417YRP4_9BACI|nr:hypothetical protein [Neobacillus notoginsengisoli]RHW37995.1 hypothetical protein D1B31_14530 [Neobacillus notoginsengisoli]